MRFFNKIAFSPDNTEFNFLHLVNNDLEHLNNLVAAYNQESCFKKEILVEIYFYYQSILDKYPGNLIAKFPYFAAHMQHEMFLEIQREFHIQGFPAMSRASIAHWELSLVNANHQPELQAKLTQLLLLEKKAFQYFFRKLPKEYQKKMYRFIEQMAKEDNPELMCLDLNQIKQFLRFTIARENLEASCTHALRNLIVAINTKLESLEKKRTADEEQVAAFADFIANMNPENMQQFAFYLDNAQFCTPYDESDPGAEEFNTLLENHTVIFLGGSNSKNFKVTHVLSNKTWILKLENCLRSPKSVAMYLAANALNNTVTTLYADRPVTFETADNKTVTRNVIVTDFCSGGDLKAYSLQQSSPQAKAEAALSIYLQMATVFEQIRLAETVFPDAKNSNWLLDEHGTLHVADTKSFMPAFNGLLDSRLAYNQWYHLIHTTYMDPPEMDQDIMNVDNLHAYLLGKNLYHFLTCGKKSELEGMHNSSLYDFSQEVFQTPVGRKLALLIKQLVKTEPVERLSVAEALHSLVTIDENRKAREQDPEKQAKAECIDLFNELLAIDGALHHTFFTPRYRAKISTSHDIQFIDKCSFELSECLELAKISLKKARERCSDLLKEILIHYPVVNVGNFKENYAHKIAQTQSLKTTTELYKELKEKEKEAQFNQLKKECRLVIARLERLSGSSFPGKIKGLESITTSLFLKKYLKGLNQELRKILEVQFDLEAECFTLIDGLSDHKINDLDHLMNGYQHHLRNEIWQDLSISSLKEMRDSLTQQLVSLQKSGIAEIKEIIQNYRRSAHHLFSINKSVKADRIETALLNLPISLRTIIFSDNPEYCNYPEVVEVRAALASHRYLGKRNNVYYVKHSPNEIDERKAATSYQRLKKLFFFSEEENQIQLESENSLSSNSATV